MENGFLYSAFKTIVDNLKYLNLVEFFKTIAVRINPKKKVAYSRIGADIFIVLKWIFIFILWYYGKTSLLLTISIWYLIVTNIYTYFYYHIWCDDALDTSRHDSDRIKRKLLTYFLRLLSLTFVLHTCIASLSQLIFQTQRLETVFSSAFLIRLQQTILLFSRQLILEIQLQ
jgi:hypothetical protein